MRATRKVLPIFLEKQKGCIINIASNGGIRGARAGAAYTASKHAVVGFTKNTGFMYAKDGIRCNAIAPGSVETNITSSMKNIIVCIKRSLFNVNGILGATSSLLRKNKAMMLPHEYFYLEN